MRIIMGSGDFYWVLDYIMRSKDFKQYNKPFT